nr:MAG TPA: hypothetical protein [Bacteriophage sp.]
MSSLTLYLKHFPLDIYTIFRCYLHINVVYVLGKYLVLCGRI